jgi:hypothetical protein
MLALAFASLREDYEKLDEADRKAGKCVHSNSNVPSSIILSRVAVNPCIAEFQVIASGICMSGLFSFSVRSDKGVGLGCVQKINSFVCALILSSTCNERVHLMVIA